MPAYPECPFTGVDRKSPWEQVSPIPRATSHGARRGLSNSHWNCLHAHRTRRQQTAMGIGARQPDRWSAGRQKVFPLPDGSHKKGPGRARVSDRHEV